jgi:hypothetical protein
MFNYPAFTIPLPSFIMEDEELAALHEKLFPFSIGDPDVRDEDGPSERSRLACQMIEQELIKRGQPVVLRGFR